MNGSEESLFATGPPSTQNVRVRARRLSEPGQPSERFSNVPNRRQSDPGREFSTFTLRRDTLRPYTQQSMNSGRRLSYGETSSAYTQSFVSFDTATETPTNNSAAGFATASDGEGSIPQYRTAARSNTVYAPRAAAERLDPRRAATLDPRQAGQTYSFVPEDYEDTDESVLAAVLDAGDQTVRGTESVPRRAMTSNSFTSQGYIDPVPDVVLDETAGRVGAQGVATAALDVGDRTVRRPEGSYLRHDARDMATPQRDPLDQSLNPSPAQHPQSDPRRSYKVSATSTVVPDRFPAPGFDDTSRPSFQESRERLPSAASSRRSEAGYQLPSTGSNMPAMDPRQQEWSQPAHNTAYTPPGRTAAPSPPGPPANTNYPPGRTGPTAPSPASSSYPAPGRAGTAAPPPSGPPVGAAHPLSGRAGSTAPPTSGLPAPTSYPSPGRTGSAAPTPPGAPANANYPPPGRTGSAPPPSGPPANTAYPLPGRAGSAVPPPSGPPAPTSYPPPGRTGSAAAPPSGPPKPAAPPRQDETVYPPRPTPPTALPNKPAPPTRQDQHAPQTPTTVRPSNASNRPLIPAKQTPQPPRKVPPVTSQRPPLPAHASQMDTRYVRMLLAIDDIPSVYNILANFFTWILLAGFVLFPGTFTSLQKNPQLSAIGVSAANVVKHVTLYVIAWVCTGVGAAGMIYLWIRWRSNYIWCLNRIFLPGFMNSLAGVLSTISSILGTQNATLSISSKSTIIVTTAVAGICGILTAFYMLVLVQGLKNEHIRKVGKQHAGKRGEGYAELDRRKGGYVNMLLALDSIPSYYNLFSQFFTWILLAGFVLFPGTFTNLQQDKELGALGIAAADTIKHVSLFVVAWVCTGLGAAGMLYLWYRWSRNYIWCTNRIFLPGFMNSLAGVLSTISSVLGTQNATLSKSSKSTLVVTTAVAGICGLLTALYMFVLIRGMKNKYERETGKHG
ncbi:hypothetical protein C8R45DRAFT_1087783 [Mycena sanguinolenta]|nr:hypothetical protein C8R45DRAFT_1087783 [Mycena sanguinolenta]